MAKKKSTAKASTAAATNSGVRRFELVEGASSKFWEVRQNGSEFTVRFGRIGTEGQPSKTKDAGSPEKATAAIEKLIREKTGKGYAEVTSPATKAKKTIARVNQSFPIEEIPVNAKVPLTKRYVQSIAVTLRKHKKHTSSYDFSRYDAITEEAAEELAPYCFNLVLSGLKDISVPVMRTLNRFAFEGDESRWHTCELDLRGLSAIGDDLAAVFSERFRDLPSFASPGSILLGVRALENLSTSTLKLMRKCKARIVPTLNPSSSHLSEVAAEFLYRSCRDA